MKPWVKYVAAQTNSDAERLLASLTEEWPLLLSEPVPPSVARTHIAMAATATSSAVPGPAVAPSTISAPPRARWRRRFTFATVTSTFVGQLLLATAAAAAVGAGAAAAGVLPDPLQSAVAELAGEMGFTVPSGTQTADPAEPGDPGEGAEPATPAVPASPDPENPSQQAQTDGVTFGLSHRPDLVPAGGWSLFDEFAELKAMVEALRSAHAAGHGPPSGQPGPPDGVPGAPDGVNVPVSLPQQP